MAEEITGFFADERNRKLLEDLLEPRKEGDRKGEPRITLEEAEPAADRGELPLDGKTFVFTGSLDAVPRRRAKELVEELGARATSSVARRRLASLTVSTRPSTSPSSSRIGEMLTRSELELVRVACTRCGHVGSPRATFQKLRLTSRWV